MSYRYLWLARGLEIVLGQRPFRLYLQESLSCNRAPTRERARLSGLMSLIPTDHGYDCECRHLPPGHVQGHAMEMCPLGRMDQSQLQLICIFLTEKRVRAIAQTLTGKDPCCIPSVLVWASHFQGSNGNNGQEPPSSSGYPHTRQNWADNLKQQKSRVWLLLPCSLSLAELSLATDFLFLFKKLSSVVLKPGCLTEPLGSLW